MKSTSLILLLLTSLVVTTTAQTTINQGQITMTLVDVNAEDEAIKEQASMIAGSKSIISFNEEYSSMDLNMMEGMISMKTITELDSGDSKILVDAMGMKYVVPMSKEEKNKMIKEQSGDGKFEIEYDKSDTKEIAGYQCYKAKAINPDNVDTMIECYLTEEIKANPKVLQGFEHLDLVGFPLEYTIGSSDMGMTFTTKEFSTKVDDSVFNFAAKGYEEMSFEEFSKMGGMGF